MDGSEVKASQAITRYSLALRRLNKQLEAQLAWNEHLIDQLGRDALLPDALVANESARLSVNMTRELAEFDRARFDMRVGVARALRSQGLSNPDIAEAFGVSRQLVHRFLAGDENSNALAVNIC
jgi:hypothetical protein